MTTSNIKMSFAVDTRTIWNIVTSLEDYSWRSDLSRIEIVNDKQFIEYTKDGYATTFTVTLEEPYKRWEFDMESNIMSGHWIGIFSQKDGMTELDFTEYITSKRIIMKPFVKGYLKKQQATYMRDLTKVLKGW